MKVKKLKMSRRRVEDCDEQLNRKEESRCLGGASIGLPLNLHGRRGAGHYVPH